MTDYADPDLDVDPDSDLETIAPLAPPPAASGAGHGSERGPVLAIAAALVVVSLIVGFAITTVVLNARDKGPTDLSVGPAPTTTAPKVPAAPVDPDAAVLGGLILRQSDVTAPNTVQLLQHGADTTVATLDLCNGTFASEAQRTARRQVALLDSASALRMSTEAVLYGRASGGAQAFAELKSVVDKCPATPVVSPVGEDTAATTFRAAPDTSWPRTPTVDRLAYDFVTTSPASGASSHSVAVYLRRGRVLMGVYFAQPDGVQTAVEGRTTIQGIVAVFEARMAKISDRVAAGG